MWSERIIKYPLIFLVAFAVTYVLTPLCRRLAVRLGMVDVPGGRRMHGRPVARCGGIAVFVGFHVGCAVLFLYEWLPFAGSADMHWWLRLFCASSLLFALGLADDRWGLPPWWKLAGQVAVAGAAYALGLNMGWFLGLELPTVVDLALTVLWLVGIVNAFNLIDGLDGLASGLACIAAAGMAGALLLLRQPGDVLVLFALLGSALAFLRYNFNPASIFLGDGGSMFLGFVLAAVALRTNSKGAAMAAIGMPLLAVGVPIFDTVLAIWRRTVRRHLNGKEANGNDKVFSGDAEHLHHRLRRAGFSQRKVAVTLYGIAAALVAVGLASLTWSSRALGIYIVAFVVGVFVVVRHLAQVELWDSGKAILRGLSRPPRKVLAVILYPPLDFLILTVAGLVAAYSAHGSRLLQEFQTCLVEEVPIWVGAAFVALYAGKTYRRVWSRARVSEYVILVAVVAGGIFMAAGLIELTGRTRTRDIVVPTVVFAGIALTGIVGMRIFPRVVQDGMAHMRRHEWAQKDPGMQHVLMYGAGYRCTLCLREHSFGPVDEQAKYRVLGILDDDTNLHGRLVYGHPVLGGIEVVTPDFLKERCVEEIVVTAPLAEGIRSRLLKAAAAAGATVVEWRTEMVPLSSMPGNILYPGGEAQGKSVSPWVGPQY